MADWTVVLMTTSVVGGAVPVDLLSGLGDHSDTTPARLDLNNHRHQIDTSADTGESMSRLLAA